MVCQRLVKTVESSAGGVWYSQF